jgi:exosortase/archaeosortase family protein
LYLPTRLVQEANPDWRLVGWALSLEVVGITLALLMQGFVEEGTAGTGSLNCETREKVHSGWSRIFNPSVILFPVFFVLVAVPWPTLVEGSLIQALTRANASATVEILGLFGVPALQHGNLIEVSTGPVGIDDACSGIRSFQASLMIALFLGHLFGLTVSRRVWCVLAGFALSFTFNVGRTSLLTYVASVKGSAAIRSWHDPAGVAILVGCFLGLWAVAEFLRKRQARKEAMNLGPGNADPDPGSLFRRLPFALAAWLLFVEVAVEGWYRWHERQLPAPLAWTVSPPESAPGFRRLPISDRTRRILRFDDAVNAVWTGPTSSRWQAIFLRWNPGRTAVHLARNHTPEVCLSAAGRSVVLQSNIQRYEVPLESRLAISAIQSTNKLVLRMPFRVFQVSDPTGPLHVFYCLWDDRASDQGLETMELTYANRLVPVLSGRRQSGQRSLEIAIWGCTQPAEAERVFRETLPKLVVAE